MHVLVEAIIGEDAIQNKGQKTRPASSQVAWAMDCAFDSTWFDGWPSADQSSGQPRVGHRCQRQVLLFLLALPA
jgi:hypothetical protein